MIRWMTISLVLVAAAMLVDARSAQAISRHNPYRSFNLTGVNYASMQWERSHRQSYRKASSSWHGRRLFLRRR